ncbi:DoxX family protein, partial [Flavobacterium sp. XS2P39]|uniref:DoxX family protein n=1 Tax=Flavobacterium sp. XS2P39 TaxID=3401725 RepID=UPI003AAFC8AB
MKSYQRIKSILIETVSLLYVLLFIYAAGSKFLDFENFQVQLGQSPLLSAFAEWVAWGVPVMELLISVLLIFPRYRLVGLFAAFNLMVMFTTYIIIILNFSSFIPCSCGGILEKLGWTEHLVFNLVFILLAAAGILILARGVSEECRILKPAALASIFSVSLFCSIGMVVFLFTLSENRMQYHNSFVRRFPHFPAEKKNQMDLKFNSYYFAGSGEGKIFLGNFTAPLQILEIDTTLKIKKTHRIELNRKNFPFRSVTIKVAPPYFFVTDGSVPCIFRGSIKDWKAKFMMQGSEYFTKIEPIDSITMVVRAMSKKNGESILGTINLRDTTTVHLSPKLLEKQIDGFLDTDGTLLYNAELERVVYQYRYRNQFIVADRNLNIDFRGTTIDTISHPKLDIRYVASTDERKFGAPAVIVNKTNAAYSNLFFVNSALPGKYESALTWKQASIIDLYNLNTRGYISS